MSKKEEIYNIRDELIDERVVAPVKSHRNKFIIAIITAATLIAATSILLIGHFKFNWFPNETYQLDAKINRVSYQANYFSESKNIKTALTFSNGNHVEKDASITTNFIVYLTDRQKMQNTYLNTASLIILDSHVKSPDADQDLTSFNIFEESTLKELEANPDGSKYPIAIFSFLEDGTIKEIKLPNNMDKYNADSIVELIGNVIPKLTRNRTEDISNGLQIKETKNKKVSTIIEAQAPREYPTFKGSKYSKTVERDIENDQITNIRVNGDAYFQTEENVDDDLGIKDFHYKTQSEIISVKTYEEKENAELIKKIADKFTFIKSEELIQSILQKEKEEKEKEIPITNTGIEEKEEETAPLRQLGSKQKSNIVNKERERQQRERERQQKERERQQRERERQQKERERQQRERERQQKERERQQKEKQERERQQREKQQREKQERERQQREKQERERKERERKQKEEIVKKEKERKERERKQKEELAKKEKERKERERKQKEELAKKEKERKERERKQKEELARKEKERKEREKKQKEELAKKEKERKERERKQKEEIVKKEKERKERERKQKEELAKKEKERKEQERKKKEELEKKKKKEEEERKKRLEELEKKKKKEEEERKKKKEELEKKKKKEEEEKKKKKEEEEKKKKKEEEEKKKKKKEEEEKKKKKKEEEEKKKKKEEEEKKKKKEEEEKKKKKEEEEKKKKENEALMNLSIERTYTLKTISFLGQSISIKYRVGVKKGKAVALIIINSKKGEAKFGTEGEGIYGSFSKTLFNRNRTLFDFPFPPFPAIHLAISAGGSIDIGAKVNFGQKFIELSLSGKITANAEIKAGSDKLLSFSAGAEGAIVDAKGYVKITKENITPGYTIKGGQVNVYVVARALQKDVWRLSYTIWKGWP